jgi:peptide methionine sulfoxide reductase msrA/msrB
MSKRELTPFEKSVILDKGTELPFSGEYVYNKAKGKYLCRQCGAPLYRSEDKFESSCGWPGFDDEIPGAVFRSPDADGVRTEITCAACGGHLGHVFTGEGHTDKNTRHCVNSVSMVFVPEDGGVVTGTGRETAIFGGGCFWGVEYMMSGQPGVTSVQSGFMGGHLRQPSYRQVCTGTTGHAEVVKVEFDPGEVSYETLARLFFEIHDPTQEGGQGPDIGDQYRSVIFYTTENQRETAEKLVKELKEAGYRVVTRIERAHTFWPAEDYHQNYYAQKGTLPYCHAYTKRF